MPTPTFSMDFSKVGIGIDFQENILMSSDRFQNLLKTFLFNLTRHSTLSNLPFQSYDQSKMSRSSWKAAAKLLLLKNKLANDYSTLINRGSRIQMY